MLSINHSIFGVFLGTPITTVTATDRGFGSNGNIKYYIWSGGQDNFQINADNGAITVTNRRNMDYDILTSYNVTVGLFIT
jgi:hypothetical protein